MVDIIAVPVYVDIFKKCGQIRSQHARGKWFRWPKGWPIACDRHRPRLLHIHNKVGGGCGDWRSIKAHGLRVLGLSSFIPSPSYKQMANSYAMDHLPPGSDEDAKGIPYGDKLEHIEARDEKAEFREAQSATTKEHNLTLAESVRAYPKAIIWSILLSSAVIMEGYDTLLVCLQPSKHVQTYRITNAADRSAPTLASLPSTTPSATSWSMASLPSPLLGRAQSQTALTSAKFWACSLQVIWLAGMGTRR